MRDDFTGIRPKDVTGWKSWSKNRIALPLHVGDDLLYHAYLLILDAVPYHGNGEDENAITAWDAECLRTLDTSTVFALLKLYPRRDRPSTGIDLTVTTADGRRLERQITGNMERDTIETILNRFFSTGGAGLYPSALTYWSGAYQRYKQSKAE